MRIHSVSAANYLRANFTNPKTPKFGVYYKEVNKKVNLLLIENMMDGKYYNAFKELKNSIEKHPKLEKLNNAYSLYFYTDCEHRFSLRASIEGGGIGESRDALDILNPKIRNKIVSKMVKSIEYLT